MTYVAGAAGAAAAAQAAIANAIKASGGIVQLDSENFIKLISRMEKPLVVSAESGLFTKTMKYITNYRGLFLYTKSKQPLRLPADVELILSQKIWIPG